MQRRTKALILKTQKEQQHKLKQIKQDNIKVSFLKNSLESAETEVELLTSEISNTPTLPAKILAGDYYSDQKYKQNKERRLKEAKQTLDIIKADHQKAVGKHKKVQKELATTTRLLKHLSKNS